MKRSEAKQDENNKALESGQYDIGDLHRLDGPLSILLDDEIFLDVEPGDQSVPATAIPQNLAL